MPSLAEFTALKAAHAAEVTRLTTLVAAQQKQIADLTANEVPVTVITDTQTGINALKAIH